MTRLDHYPNDPDPERAAAAVQELKVRGKGWKLHLNFDASDDAVTKEVDRRLKRLFPRYTIGEGGGKRYKIGEGGGKKSGAVGKEATVYVGPKDDADAAARTIEHELDDLLLMPARDALKSDTKFTERVMGRFEVAYADSDFHHTYSVHGVPVLWKDARNQWRESDRRPEPELVEAARQLLISRYGTFYTGTQGSDTRGV
jgi:hypothetical protein